MGVVLSLHGGLCDLACFGVCEVRGVSESVEE